MKTWLKNIIGIILILIGIAAIRYGEIDDSPGLMLIGFVMIVGVIVVLFKDIDRASKFLR